MGKRSRKKKAHAHAAGTRFIFLQFQIKHEVKIVRSKLHGEDCVSNRADDRSDVSDAVTLSTVTVSFTSQYADVYSNATHGF